jgi:HAD superfamily hydrolase (TIGR01450 family)
MTQAPGKIFEGYVFDLDGTVYLGDELLPGAKETLDALKRLSKVVYLTNKPLQTPADYATKLTRLGVETSPEEVVSSTDALLLYLKGHAPEARLFVIGEKPLVNLLRAGGYEVLDGADGVDAVVVSFDRTFDYRKLKVAFDAVRAGARVVATNPDAYCPTPDGGLPDCAAMLAAVEASTGVRAEAVVGKPSRHMARAVLDRLGVPARNTLLVGDRLATDVRLAKEAGMAAALVLTGATGLEEALGSVDRPDYILGSLADLLPPRDKPRTAARAPESRED